MPAHTKSKSHSGATADPKPKTKSPAAGGAGKTRSAVTGRQLGRAAIRSLNKNADHASEYSDAVLAATSLPHLQALISESKILARVLKPLGCGRLSVTLQTGETEVNVPISGVLRFKGHANKKTDRDNCMCAGDFVLVDGGISSAKLTKCTVSKIRRVFTRLGATTPAGFFSESGEEEDEEGLAGVFEWDRSEEEAAERAAEEARLAEEARKAIVKAGGAGRGGRPRGVRVGRDELEEDAETDRIAAADLLDAREEDDGEYSPAPAGAAAAAVDRTAPNRAERRAAAARARAEAEAAAAAAARAAAVGGGGFDLYAAAEEEEFSPAPIALRPKPLKSWEELMEEDEVDVDAI